MVRRDFAALLVLAVAACGGDGQAAPRSDAPPRGADPVDSSGRPSGAPESEPPAMPAPPPASVRAFIDSVRAEEQALASATPRVLRPAWDRLVLFARDGSRKVLDDRLDGDAIVRVHVYRDHIETIDHHLVEVIEFEGGHFILIDAASVLMTEIDSTPAVSPDGPRFVTASLDLVAGHVPNRLRIHRLTPDGPVVEWSLAPADWGAANPEWLDEKTIRFDRVTIDWDRRPLAQIPVPALLQRGDTGWTVAAGR